MQYSKNLVALRLSVPCNRNLTHQRGVVLISVVMFLIVLAALGAASMNSAKSQERMSGVFYDRAVALSAADSALSDGMEFLLLPDFDTVSAASKVRVGQDLFASAAFDGLSVKSWVQSNLNWLTGANSFRLGAADQISDALLRVKDNPGYVVDRFTDMGITTTSKFQVFRVTARGGGGRAETSVYTHVLTRIPVPSGI